MHTPKFQQLHRAPLTVKREMERRIDAVEDPIRAWRGPRDAVLMKTETGWLVSYKASPEGWRFRLRPVTVPEAAEDEVPAPLWRHMESGKCWFILWEVTLDEEPHMRVWDIKSVEDLHKVAWCIQHKWQHKDDTEGVCLHP